MGTQIKDTVIYDFLYQLIATPNSVEYKLIMVNGSESGVNEKIRKHHNNATSFL